MNRNGLLCGISYVIMFCFKSSIFIQDPNDRNAWDSDDEEVDECHPESQRSATSVVTVDRRSE